MTYVTIDFSNTIKGRKTKSFTVEVITFDGDSHIEEVSAKTPEEAQEIAASLYDDVDYTMVQGCYEY